MRVDLADESCPPEKQLSVFDSFQRPFVSATRLRGKLFRDYKIWFRPERAARHKSVISPVPVIKFETMCTCAQSLLDADAPFPEDTLRWWRRGLVGVWLVSGITSTARPVRAMMHSGSSVSLPGPPSSRLHTVAKSRPRAKLPKVSKPRKRTGSASSR